MELFRVHAYTVLPSRKQKVNAPVGGGAVTVGAELRNAIEENITAARFSSRTQVDFRFPDGLRSSGVRDMVMNFAFGTPPEAKSSAVALGTRLAEAMDRRSSSCLFVLTAMRDGKKRSVTLWTFPKDTVLQFRTGASGPSIDVVRDVFSQKSHLRKAAMFEGRQTRSDFLSGRVLDFQADSTSRDVAEFWAERFLDCQLGIHDEAGTRMLARALRRAYRGMGDPEAQEQLHAAMMAIRNAPKKRTSLQRFANDYLSGHTKEMFLRSVPKQEVLAHTFAFRKSVFDEVLKFSVYKLDTDVYVSSPFSQLGKSVKVVYDGQRTLTCKGIVVQESVRARHG